MSVSPYPSMSKWRNAFFLITTPDMPTRMRKQIEEMQGYNLQLVIHKKLIETDMNEKDGRLFLIIKKILFDFITPDEEKLLNDANGVMEVKILDEGQRVSPMFLTKGKIQEHDAYCLTTHWNSFVAKNCLKIGHLIQLWSFRRVRLVDIENEIFTSDLYFALNTMDGRCFL
ncbi:B3 domain-containing protein At1g05930-like [Cucurbita moschata]|uniref:B3 domain-containing protein At1g05930-like n=1 Tax=Cucurbita moschata TaxID=3662 RepID=A0A6J1FJF6_CUCMO|nr:B3 domain-containing protein At1g05930-like [Cucurbita moschata]